MKLALRPILPATAFSFHSYFESDTFPILVQHSSITFFLLITVPVFVVVPVVVVVAIVVVTAIVLVNLSICYYLRGRLRLLLTSKPLYFIDLGLMLS